MKSLSIFVLIGLFGVSCAAFGGYIDRVLNRSYQADLTLQVIRESFTAVEPWIPADADRAFQNLKGGVLSISEDKKISLLEKLALISNYLHDHGGASRSSKSGN